MDDADHVDGAAIGQQADMVRMSVDVCFVQRCPSSPRSCELMTGALHVRETRGTRAGSGKRLHKESLPHLARAGSARRKLMSRARQL